MGRSTSSALGAAVIWLGFWSASAAAGIVGSAHDFAGKNWSGGKICAPCHTPHDADTSATGAPLWNHQVTQTTYTLYTSDTLDVAAQQPQGNSRLCLSCHDGTVALDSFRGKMGSTFIGGDANFGTDLSDDHPISIQWVHQDVSGGPCGQCHSLHPSAFVSPLPFFGAAGSKTVECATCHDVHNGSGLSKLLRLPKEGSQLCFHCHNK